MISIEQLVQYAAQQNCSDIHLSVKEGCWLRHNGILERFPLDKDTNYRDLILSLCSPEQRQKVLGGMDADFAYALTDGKRQRVNVYQADGNLACAIRLLNNYIPTLEELRLPPILRTLALKPRGLVLVTGPTGSGKSTTLAAMIEEINISKAAHIVTIEDPIEYVYEPKKSLIHQREVGRDTKSFASALRSVLREDPDVIMVGEMRDYETVSAAVTAAETGHLVLSTLHTTGAAQTIDRIVDVCPDSIQPQMRAQLSIILQGIITQTLIPLADRSGRIAATEILIGTDSVLHLIRENKSFQLASSLQTGSAQGMHTLDNDLARLARSGKITAEEALMKAQSPSEMQRLL